MRSSASQGALVVKLIKNIPPAPEHLRSRLNHISTQLTTTQDQNLLTGSPKRGAPEMGDWRGMSRYRLALVLPNNRLNDIEASQLRGGLLGTTGQFLQLAVPLLCWTFSRYFPTVYRIVLPVIPINNTDHYYSGLNSGKYAHYVSLL